MPKKQKKYESTEHDHFTMVLEDIRSHFRVFGEGLENIQSAVQMLSVKFDTLEERMFSIESQILSVKVDISQTNDLVTRESTGGDIQGVCRLGNVWGARIQRS